MGQKSHTPQRPAGRKSANKKGVRRPPRKGRAKTGKQAVETAEKYAKVLELRKQGKTLQAIADELGYSHPSGAHQALTRAIEHTVAEPAEEVRALETMRLDALFEKAWERMADGELLGKNGAGDFILRLMARRAKLMGLDAPDKLDLNLKASPQETEEAVVEMYKSNPELWKRIKQKVEGK